MSEDRSKKYWKCMEDLERPGGLPDSAYEEFGEAPDLENGRFGRRGFLKAAGFAFAVSALEGCSRLPVRKAIPYLNPPEDIVPGKSYYYATTCGACSAGCGMLARVRDGRPVKLEGNPSHPLAGGGACAAGQAALLGLYDSLRLTGPTVEGKPVSWEEADRAVREGLEGARRGGVRLLTGTMNGPAQRKAIEGFLSGFADARHVMYDALSSSSILQAHEATHGVRRLPRYRFDRANVVVGFDADFLGTWISPVEHAAGYRKSRKLEGKRPEMSFHAQIEARMSLTGSNADRRIALAPDRIGPALIRLGEAVAHRAGAPAIGRAAGESGVSEHVLEELAGRLWAARGEALVVCGIQDAGLQAVCNHINQLLDSYGKTIDLTAPSNQKLGDDRELYNLLEEVRAGKVSALFIAGANPVYDLPDGAAFGEALKSVPLVVSLSDRQNETAAAAKILCPSSHWLECWSDAEPADGVAGVRQPLTPRLGNTRPLIETLAAWSGAPKTDYEFVQEVWRDGLFPRSGRGGTFQEFWDRAVHDGFVELEPAFAGAPAYNQAAAQRLAEEVKTAGEGLALILYPKVGLMAGEHAYNPWLQELPDPISKATWDNYAAVSPETAKALGLAEGDMVRVTVPVEGAGERSLELPAYLQPGQHEGAVAVALGYGAAESARFAAVGPKWLEGKPGVGENGLVGKNAAPLLALDAGALQYVRGGARIEKLGKRADIATTQRHHYITVPEKLAVPGGERRPCIQETTLEAYEKDRHAGALEHGHEAKEKLWPDDHPYKGRHWGLAVDLTACTGCSACLIACQVENNVPVVGKDEVLRSREMHWIRIDRYYSGEGTDVDVAHQPMMCSQCDNAPCETVCPVLATVHSEEGLNQQVYNRCVGTRYCANNCPYKVRRFNWFNYPHPDKLQNLSLNPDVTVRMRGIMEKCTFCVQRIQEAKIEAKRRGVPLEDGEIKTACQQTCPSDAIAFGDTNDPKSAVSRKLADPRCYRVLEELDVRPSVEYLRIVRNRPEEHGKEEHGG